MEEANHKLCFVHVQYVGLLNERAEQVENKKRVFPTELEIFIAQFKNLEDRMNARNGRGRTSGVVVFQSIISIRHKPIVELFERNEEL